MRRILLMVLMLSACRDDRPVAPSAEQSDQLNDAEDLLDGMDTNIGGQNEKGPNEKGPEDRSSSPSNID